MAFFTQDFIDFFKELATNNNRDWFTEQKKRYETSVKKPFEEFVGEMIQRLQKLDKSIQILPKEAIFRIYKDVRFSKDKTPYKVQASAIIKDGGRKEMTYPGGAYIEITPEYVRVYGGAYQPGKDHLFNIRQAITRDPKGFQKLLNAKEFKEKFETIRGEQNKRIPKEFKELVEQQPLIANKQFYYFHEMSPETILQEDFPEKIIDAYKAGKKMADWLQKAMKG